MQGEAYRRNLVLWISTVAFTLMFAVWLMLGVLGVPIQEEMGLTDVQFGWLGATAILAGSLPRFNFGIWTDLYGGRRIFVALLLTTAASSYLVCYAATFEQLLVCTLLFGLAGNSFTVGIAWNAAWFPKEKQGLALGIFGAGNVGASATKLIFGIFGAALLTAIPAAGLFGGLLPGGWRFYPALYAVLLVVMAGALWRLSPRPDLTPAKGRTYREILSPLKHARVWEYSLQYAVVFGAYVAISMVLPKYLVSNYGDSIRRAFGLAGGAESATDVLRIASLLTTLYIFPASLLRPVGGWLSDRFGPARVMGAVFAIMLVSGGLLSLPVEVDLWVFVLLVVTLGCGMGIGKAGVYKLIPDFFPRDVGAVGGLVGALGAMGGFVLPPAWVYLNQWTGVPQMTFGLLTALTLISTLWFCASQMLAARVVESVAAPSTEFAPVQS